MAATPGKASPKSQESSKADDMKDPPHPAAEPSDPEPVSQPPPTEPTTTLLDPPPAPTYEGTEASRHFQIAKTLLANGDFETALATIEEGIQVLQEQLAQPEGLHEAMAPFHYLYGTTLLYSIEESTDPQQPMGGDTEEDDDADDMQLAWEHLDLARNITETYRSDKSLDLAQIYLRLGDLQRQNNQCETALLDYTKCLELRRSILPKFSRLLADVHYCLGLVYFQIKDIQNGTLQFYQTGRIFAGIIAELCGADPEQIVQSENNTLQYKSTGDNDDDHPDVMVEKLVNLQNEVAKLNVTEEVKLQVDDLKDMMVEIQETIQEAENSLQGVEQATELKEQITAMVAATAAAEARAEGSTTTIGFGGSTENETQSTIGFGASLSTATAQPATLIPKKKKKAPSDVDDLPPKKCHKAE